MRYLNYFQRIQLLHKLIKRRNTGKADELCTRLNISRRTLFLYLELFRDHGANIKFCRKTNTYYYEEEFFFQEFFLDSAI
ncbi:HTH domain-containing protein [Marivirga sp. S37H4]|uniref:HTH domain-containing protein n=1 Tax=Marivirga aurantiaca TaxID=2802615 RepID=A0A934X2Y1_9BACT|nr:HTH domain-containing protein [Marivirga aurantiaca]MBK6267410.1 HTH domain-containing protein [Marivirga aurantiaca]